MFKHSYDDDNYKKINVEKKLKRGERRSGKEVCLSQKYVDKRPISVEKKKDLISFCNSLIIPPIYWPFYNSLTTNTTDFLYQIIWWMIKIQSRLSRNCAYSLYWINLRTKMLIFIINIPHVVHVYNTNFIIR